MRKEDFLRGESTELQALYESEDWVEGSVAMRHDLVLNNDKKIIFLILDGVEDIRIRSSRILPP